MDLLQWAKNYFRAQRPSGIVLAQGLLGILIFITIWTFAHVASVTDYDSEVRTTFRLEANLVRNFEEHVRRNLLAVDENLLFFKEEYEKNGKVTPAILERMEKIKAVPAVQVLMMDKAGYITASLLPLPEPNMNGVYEDFFQHHIFTDSGKPYIAKPIMGRVSGKLSFHVSRRLNAPDGSFAGVVAIAVDPAYFANFFNLMELGDGQLLLVIGTDGVPRVWTADNSDQPTDLDFTNSTLMGKSAQAMAGSYFSRGAITPGASMISYRVMADYPLVLAIGMSSDAALADYRRRSGNYNVAATGLSFVLLFAFSGLIQMTLNRQRAARLQIALYRISEAAGSATNLDDLYRSVHITVSELTWARHFIITLYDEKRNTIDYAYFADGKAGKPAPRPFARGFTEYVVRTGKPLRADENKVKELIATGEIDTQLRVPKGWLGVPLKAADNRIFGVMVARAYDGEPGFTEEDQEIFTFVSRQVAMAIERKRADESLQYLGLHDTLTGLNNRAFFEEMLAELEKSRRVPVAIIVCDVDGLKLINDTFGHSAGDQLLLATARIIQQAIRRDDVAARIGGDEFAIILPGANEKAAEIVVQRIKSLLPTYHHNSGIPLSLSVGYQVKKNKSVSMAELLLEADKHMYREKLHHSQSVRSEAVETMMKLLEVRDFMTEDHAKRLQDLATELARQAGLPERRLADIRLLAKFHDIGKVGIPDNILFKPGPLTPEERKEMERHCDIGYRIAKTSTDLAPIADWILRHQEWWNGGGYPLGLASEDIPIEARIISIVDAYDAMTNDRPYRKALSHQQALDELRRCAGLQFDPRLVGLFVELVGEKE